LQSTKWHNVVPLGASDAQELLSSSEDASLQCSSHPVRPAQLHCSSCSQLLCNECLALHTWHELETIADARQRYLKELKWCSDKLNERMKQYNDCRQQTDQLNANLDEIKTEILKKADEMTRLIDEHKQMLLDELESIRAGNTANSALLNSDAARSLARTLNFTKELAEMGSDHDLIWFSKYLIDSANKHLQSSIDSVPVVKQYKFAVKNVPRRTDNVVGSIGKCIIYFAFW
jgi:DNA repair ATPase RecN